MADVMDMDQSDLFDDENLEVVDAEVVTDANPIEETAVEEVKSPSETAVATNSTLGGIGLDFSALAATLPGVVVGNTGLTVSRFPVERIKFSKGQRSCISILSDQVIVAKTHYDEDRGSFLCFGGACCDHDLARVRYVYPIVQYVVNPKGAPIANIDDKGKPQHPLYEVSNKCLVIGQETYESLLAVQEMKGSLTKFDFLVSCTDDQYQKITLQEAGEARYKKDKKLVADIQEFWKQNGKNILKSVARKITPEEYASQAAADLAAGAEVDFDDVFGE